VTEPASRHAATLLLGLVAAMGLACPGTAAAQVFLTQYDPAFRWRTLQTDHFEIHYHQGEEALARRLAAAAERAHRRMVPILGYAPPERTQVVLSDDTDDANGSATPLPRNTIRLYAVPPESTSVLEDERDWLAQLIEHEYVHILHLDNVGGLPWFIDRIFGKLLVPNGFTPGWMIEGIAVANEASDPGTGRNASALFDMYARALVLEPPGLPPLAEITNQPLEWPRGHDAYLLGGRFMAFLAERNGWPAMRGFLADQGAQLYPWAPSFQTERWFGASLPVLWDEFRQALEHRYAAQLSVIRGRPVTHPTRLTHRGSLVERPRWSPDGRSLVYLDHGGDERPGLRRIGLDGAELGRLLHPADLHGLFDLRSEREAVVSKAQVWHEFRIYDDLWLVDLDRGKERRLTDGERATDPALTPDGAAVVYVARAGGGELELRRRALDGGPPELLLRRPGAQLYDPAVSPDGRRIALSIQEGGRRDVALLEDGQLTRVTDDDALDLTPCWSPDGRYLLFASDRGGVFNLYAWEVATATLRQVTNLETGALSPAVSPDGATIAFVGYGRAGHDVAIIPFDPTTWLDPVAAPPVPELAAGPAPESTAVESRPYRPWTALPTFWLPLWSADGAGTVLGAYTGGSDVVGLHTWLAEGWWSLKSQTVGYAASYLGGWSWPGLDLSSYRVVTASPGTPDRLLTVWAPLDGGLTFTFTRLEQALQLRLGWSASRWETLGAPVPTTGLLPDYRFDDGLLTEATLAAAWTDARRYAFSISQEEGRTIALKLRLATPKLGGDYTLWRARASWSEYLRIPWTRHVVLAARLSGALARGSLGGSAPFSLGGMAQPSLIDLFLLQSFSPADQLRGYPAGRLGGFGIALLNLELRAPLLSPGLGWSTWPLFLRRIHGALFADLGEAFTQGTERGYLGYDFHWKRLRLGVGAELRLETVFAYWLLTDLRLGVARGMGKPLDHLGPTQDPIAEWQFYFTFGPSF
jgi:hypothetical protein